MKVSLVFPIPFQIDATTVNFSGGATEDGSVAGVTHPIATNMPANERWVITGVVLPFLLVSIPSAGAHPITTANITFNVYRSGYPVVTSTQAANMLGGSGNGQTTFSLDLFNPVIVLSGETLSTNVSFTFTGPTGPGSPFNIGFISYTNVAFDSAGNPANANGLFTGYREYFPFEEP